MLPSCCIFNFMLCLPTKQEHWLIKHEYCWPNESICWSNETFRSPHAAFTSICWHNDSICCICWQNKTVLLTNEECFLSVFSPDTVFADQTRVFVGLTRVFVYRKLHLMTICYVCWLKESVYWWLSKSVYWPSENFCSPDAVCWEHLLA